MHMAIQKSISFDITIYNNSVLNKKPKSFLEIGVFHGVTARNACELLYKIHGNDFYFDVLRTVLFVWV